jgi:phosphohistidine swiveling domain-containing protein
MLIDAYKLVSAGRLSSQTQVFDLTLEDLEKAASDQNYDLKTAARVNREFADRLASVPTLPTIFDSRGCILKPTPPVVREGEVAGTPIAQGVARGRVKVLRRSDEKPFFRGEILVSPATDPGWMTLLVNAGAVVLEIGGTDQHEALVAREYGLPCVAGVANATTLWPDGTLVEVDGTAGIVRVINE